MFKLKIEIVKLIMDSDDYVYIESLTEEELDIVKDGYLRKRTSCVLILWWKHGGQTLTLIGLPCGIIQSA